MNTDLTSHPVLSLNARKSKNPNVYLDITVLIFKKLFVTKYSKIGGSQNKRTSNNMYSCLILIVWKVCVGTVSRMHLLWRSGVLNNSIDLDKHYQK